ncbi:hypothetical protein DICPUDRAFT_97944 [Dictyostelium purpureum]|uniref:Cobalamin-independent methionine synthase MetE C-terminal/archaeal domain-containing protein n=1 Tax=Dictyostelium purpureum TaxID=5786 RepID=F0ZL91_DICPU|nr:uncharacterized protein DICPUDRAFT_97944 [Dictyostelium purpureum]EGC35259.1 hypothetical protein DICPUDRAFT_97944 [Dictyostelium purpureum]|eukprot:XP_003288185.1 hypothetical protein DICPUDRAFT_97944 [Dictyostelium purpureum]
MKINIPTEPIGSIPRPRYLIDSFKKYNEGLITYEEYMSICDKSLEETVHGFLEAGSVVITDGEQYKPNFITYPIHGSNQVIDQKNNEKKGFIIQFQDGHIRQLPILSGKNLPFKYKQYANEYLSRVKKMFPYAKIKQTIISVSAMSLIYPANQQFEKYSKDEFYKDMLNEVEKEIRMCLETGVESIQIDATEARLSLKIDPSGQMLKKFIDLNNQLLIRFNDEEIQKIGIHSCPGGDKSFHSSDVDYCRLLIPSLFKLRVSRFYLEFAAEKDKIRILECIAKNIKPHQIVFFGVINVVDPRVETPEEVRDLVLEIAKYIPLNQIGTCCDCGYSPFSQPPIGGYPQTHSLESSREIAFKKIKSRVEGTKMAEDILNHLFSISISTNPK